MLDVLVVDDDFMVAKIHAEYVRSLPGFRVVGAANTGAEALEEVARLHPNVILLDVHLPDMSGLDVLSQLRRDAMAVDAIIVTAERGAEYVRAALRGGATQYLVKPFDLDELKERLEHYRHTVSKLPEGRIDQRSIDAVFPAPVSPTSTTPAPKGLSAESVNLVRNALRDQGEMSASDAAQETGMARVSARRYLEHLVSRGEASVRLQYGAGRPTRLYKLRNAST
ncbi:response regulator [Ornithinimicrobium ciconiae]|uniref:Transcriptional regulatory protein n=1 Tax=Ornithinimicrobium ciconiae TaxID=2594265 RepID=A0A516GG18_9MICO|nr:response regulator [Ornithinimicrobium ciconiae]